MRPTADRASAPRYEVHCPRCRVTHPLGTRTCVHCGGRTAPAPLAPALEAAPAGAPGAEPEEVEAEAVRPPRALRIAVTLTWVLLALLASLYRVCRGE